MRSSAPHENEIKKALGDTERNLYPLVSGEILSQARSTEYYKILEAVKKEWKFPYDKEPIFNAFILSILQAWQMFPASRTTHHRKSFAGFKHACECVAFTWEQMKTPIQYCPDARTSDENYEVAIYLISGMLAAFHDIGKIYVDFDVAIQDHDGAILVKSIPDTRKTLYRWFRSEKASYNESVKPVWYRFSPTDAPPRAHEMNPKECVQFGALALEDIIRAKIPILDKAIDEFFPPLRVSIAKPQLENILHYVHVADKKSAKNAGAERQTAELTKEDLIGRLKVYINEGFLTKKYLNGQHLFVGIGVLNTETSYGLTFPRAETTLQQLLALELCAKPGEVKILHPTIQITSHNTYKPDLFNELGMYLSKETTSALLSYIDGAEQSNKSRNTTNGLFDSKCDTKAIVDISALGHEVSAVDEDVSQTKLWVDALLTRVAVDSALCIRQNLLVREDEAYYLAVKNLPKHWFVDLTGGVDFHAIEKYVEDTGIEEIEDANTTRITFSKQFSAEIDRGMES